MKVSIIIPVYNEEKTILKNKIRVLTSSIFYRAVGINLKQ